MVFLHWLRFVLRELLITTCFLQHEIHRLGHVLLWLVEVHVALSHLGLRHADQALWVLVLVLWLLVPTSKPVDELNQHRANELVLLVGLEKLRIWRNYLAQQVDFRLHLCKH